MNSFLSRRLAPVRAALAGGLLGIAAMVHAAEGGFTASLSAAARDATGVAQLTAVECDALDQFVAAELAAAARPGNPVESNGPFVARLSDAKRSQAGLDRLATGQLAKLDELVAAAVATRPKPRERPRLKETDVLAEVRKPQIHGSVSLTYGWVRGGGDFRGASLWLDYFDPGSGLGLSVGLTHFDGAGFYGFYPGDYGPLHDWSSPAYSGASFRNSPQTIISGIEGRSFRGLGGRGSFVRDDHHER